MTRLSRIEILKRANELNRLSAEKLWKENKRLTQMLRKCEEYLDKSFSTMENCEGARGGGCGICFVCEAKELLKEIRG